MKVMFTKHCYLQQYIAFLGRMLQVNVFFRQERVFFSCIFVVVLRHEKNMINTDAL